jgi:hypothetical protein
MPGATDERRQLSLLELVLPAGRAARARVIGSACPEALLPAADRSDGAELPDLLVIAPSERECREPGWLAAACSTRVAADGVAYVLVPARSRRRSRGLLRAAGRWVEGAILHLPNAAESRQLVPLAREPARHAFANVVPLAPWKQALAGALLALGAGRVISSGAPGVALVARPAGARPLLEWLPLSGAADGARRSAIVSPSRKPGGSSVVLQPFAAGAEAVVAKLTLRPGEGAHGEHARLERMGAAAARAGAVVPRALGELSLHGNPVLLESRLEGRIAAPLLARDPALLAPLLERLCSWLGAWQELTASRAPLTRERLEAELLAPARALAPSLEGGERYLAALEERCSAAEGTMAPLTAAHGDLTMWNVLVEGPRLGIVDWEVAEEATLPLKDLYYALADAVAATRRYTDRPAAVRACFERGGAQEGMIAPLRSSLAGALALPAGVAELSFHACWLGHALNEARSLGPSDPAPFRDIVQWLARSEAP